MNIKRLAALLLSQVTFALVLRTAGFAQGPLAPTASEIDQSVTAASRDLYGQNEAARALGAKAKAVLVFPDIKKAAFIVGRSTDTARCGEGERPLVTTGRVLLLMDSRPE